MRLPAGHKFPAEKYALVRECLEREAGFEFTPAPFAPLSAIELAHDRGYVERFVDGSLAAAAVRRIGFPWSEGLVRRTLASAGGTLAAARDAIEHGWGGNLAGGTHHAFRDAGSGFCVFNDFAVAILWLRRECGIARAAVIDLDVHQGDGTAAIFAGDADVFTLSLHGRNNFPFRKQRSRLDVEFADSAGDEEYLGALAAVLPRVFDFHPHVVLYQAGVDALASDRLGRLALSPAGLAERDRLVFSAVASAGAPLVLTLGGGYSQPIRLTAEAHAATYRAARRMLSRGSQNNPAPQPPLDGSPAAAASGSICRCRLTSAAAAPRS